MTPADRGPARDRSPERRPDSPTDNATLQPDAFDGPAGPAAEAPGVALANGPGAPAGLASEPATSGVRGDSLLTTDVAARPSSFGDPEIAPDPSSAEDGTSADLLLADQAPTVGGTLLGRARDPHDHTEWHETPGGTLLAPGEGG